MTDYSTRPTIIEPIVSMFTEVAENYLTVLKVMTGQTESDDKKVIDGIKDYCARNGIADVKDLIGCVR